MRVLEALIGDLCCMWSIGEESKISHLEKTNRFRLDMFFFPPPKPEFDPEISIDLFVLTYPIVVHCIIPEVNLS